MHRAITILFCIFLVGISLIGLKAGHTELPFFLTINKSLTIGRILLAFVLLVGALFSSFSSRVFRGFLATIGLGLMATTVFGLLSSEVLYLRPMDFFITLEGFILCMLASTNYGHRTVPKKAVEYTENKIPAMATSRISPVGT